LEKILIMESQNLAIDVRLCNFCAWILVIMRSHIWIFATAKAKECDDCRMAFTKFLVHSNLERVSNIYTCPFKVNSY
jgi:hypothetical protein